MLGLCWAILGLCWAFVGSFGALLAAFGPEKKNPTENFSVGGFFGVGFGLMLGHLEVMLGLCWAILGLCWAFVGSFGVLLAAFGPKKIPPTENVSVGGFFGVGFGLMLGHLEVMLGLCWAILGLCWAFVGSFGVLLAAFGPKKIPPTENVSVGGNFGSVLGLCWPIWKLCWDFAVPSSGHVGTEFGNPLRFRNPNAKESPLLNVLRLIVYRVYW